MGGQTITTVSLVDLLPDSIKGDAQVLASAKALDAELLATAALIDGVAVYAGLDSATEPLLSTLAWQLHVDGLEGWALAETDAQKRDLIRTAIEAHRHKGTRWAMERVFDLLGMPGKISEWWEYSGAPYTFRVDVFASGRSVTADFYASVSALVEELKNVRSHLAGLTVATATSGLAYVGAYAQFGATVAVYPYQDTEISTSGASYMGAATAYYSTITVYPEA